MATLHIWYTKNKMDKNKNERIFSPLWITFYINPNAASVGCSAFSSHPSCLYILKSVTD